MNYYEEHAEEYLSQVRKVDMSSLYAIFLSYLPKKAKILDVGFASCRDMAYFSSLVYEVEGIDSCKTFVKEASLEGFLVFFKKVEDLEEKEKYDAIWASASLLHCQNLSDVFFRLYCALKKGGVLYCSFKEGNFTGERDGRYYHDFTLSSFEEFLSHTPFIAEELFLTKDQLGERNINWVNAILRKRIR